MVTNRLPSRRGTSNSNRRGGSDDRRRRRQWLVEHYGDGEFVACYLQHHPKCQYVLDVDTVSVDRLNPGGSYGRDNIQPACSPCQSWQGYLMGIGRKALTPTGAGGIVTS